MLLLLSGVFSNFGGLAYFNYFYSQSSVLSNWWENRMTLSITWKVSEADLILPGSSVSSSMSLFLDTSITSSAGFYVFQCFPFEFPDARKCCPHLLLVLRKQDPCQIHLIIWANSPSSSFTKLADSSPSSWCSVCRSQSSALLRKLHLRKQLVAAWPETSSHAALIQEISFNTSASWIILEVFLLSSIWEMTNFKSFFLCLILQFLIMPASTGCNLDVKFLGKKTTLVFQYGTTKFSRWQGALSIKSKMFLLAAAIFRLILVNTESIISLVIQDFWLE